MTVFPWKCQNVKLSRSVSPRASYSYANVYEVRYFWRVHVSKRFISFLFCLSNFEQKRSNHWEIAFLSLSTLHTFFASVFLWCPVFYAHWHPSCTVFSGILFFCLSSNLASGSDDLALCSRLIVLYSIIVFVFVVFIFFSGKALLIPRMILRIYKFYCYIVLSNFVFYFVGSPVRLFKRKDPTYA